MTEVVLWESPNKKWQVRKFLKNGRVRVDVTDGHFVDYPILIDLGMVSYDHPYKIPQYVKSKVGKILRDMKQAGTFDERIN